MFHTRRADGPADSGDRRPGGGGPRRLPPEALVERVAGIWSLVEGIDPEIARRRTRYTTPDT
ncbi:hypothetical protein ACFQY7_39410 [Actinomadura luteofluorescens]|uniref:hypothetical protein n=1 Tax=Actinomadura luteofluorescens TaxID=46163 RepID=UPI00363F6860